MATFEEQCKFVADAYMSTTGDEIDETAAKVSQLFSEKYDLAGPLALAIANGDVAVTSNNPAKWIAEAYLGIKKIRGESESEKIIEDNSNSGRFENIHSQEAHTSSDEEAYEFYPDPEQTLKAREFQNLIHLGKFDELEPLIHGHLEYLSQQKNVDLVLLYGLANELREDETKTETTHQLSKKIYEFLTNYRNPVGGAAINSLVFSFLQPSGELESAEKLLTKLIEWDLGYESLNAVSNYGQILVKRGNLFGAEILFALIRSLNTEELQSEACYWLGVIFHSTKRDRLANKAWAECREIATDSYRERSQECLDGLIPSIDLPDQVQQFQMKSFELLRQQGFPGDLNSSYALEIIERLQPDFKSLASELKFENKKPRNFSELMSLIGAFSDDDSEKSVESFAAILSTLSGYMVDDEISIRLSVELAFQALRKGYWPALAVLAKSGYVMGDLKLALSSWKLLHEFVMSQTQQLPESVTVAWEYSTIVISFQLRLDQKNDLFDEILKLGPSNLKGLVATNAFKLEQQGRLNEALDLLEKESDVQLEKALAAVGLIRSQDWVTVQKHLEKSELIISNNSAVGFRSNFLTHLGENTSPDSPKFQWQSGIERLAVAILSGYLLDWDLAVKQISAASSHGEDYKALGKILLRKMCGPTILRRIVDHAGDDSNLIEMVAEVGGDVEALILLRANKAESTIETYHPQVFAAFRGSATEAQQLYLASSEEPQLLILLTQLENLSEAVVEQLLRTGQTEVLIALLENKHVDEERLIEISKNSESTEIAWKLASSPFAGPTLLGSLSKHDSESVRRAVATNKNTSNECFEALASDVAWTVRDAVTKNPSAPDTAKALAILID